MVQLGRKTSIFVENRNVFVMRVVVNNYLEYNNIINLLKNYCRDYISIKYSILYKLTFTA